MEAINHREPGTLDELYDAYVQACDQLRIAPLLPCDLWALLQALAERPGAMRH